MYYDVFSKTNARNHKKLDLGKINKAEVFLNVFDTLFGRGTIHFHKSTKAKINASYARLRVGKTCFYV